MFDLAVIKSAVVGVKKTYDVAKGLMELSKDVAVKEKAMELLGAIADLQGKLIETQQGMFEMQDELRSATEELSRRTNFDRYELVEPYPGTRLYQLIKAAAKPGEPMHYICPNCKDVLGKLSILQSDGEDVFCQYRECGRTFQIRSNAPRQVMDHNPYG